MRFISNFPQRSGHDPATLIRPDYPAVRKAAANLVSSGHVNDIIVSTYSHLFVDEYQDCSIQQNRIAIFLSRLVPTCIFADPLQAIFGFNRNDELPDWESKVIKYFPVAGELTTPWRWKTGGSIELGEWLLDARNKLIRGLPIDLIQAPATVKWIQLNGTSEDRSKALAAARIKAVTVSGSVIIIEDSRNKAAQHTTASQTPGAIMVEAVDLGDLVTFSSKLDIDDPDCSTHIVNFAASVMTNVGAKQLLDRIEILERGKQRSSPNMVEKVILDFRKSPTYENVSAILERIQQLAGVRVYRPEVLRICMRALRASHLKTERTFHETIISMREQNRALGRGLPKRGVGSTLLVKGLESEIVVIMDADALDARHLYVAITRGSHQLVICSRTAILQKHL
jgi:DNA helicase-2/ATP-dependent DNA helicase PcrA